MSSVLKRRRLLRLVLDTSVIVAALRSRNGASRRMLELLVDGSFVMIATPALFLEYESVLRRPEHSVVHGQSEAETDLFIATLARYTELVRINFNWRPQLADANDEFVLEAAINGTADAIVTFNVADFLPAAQDFGIEVKRPGSIIKGGLIQ